MSVYYHMRFGKMLCMLACMYSVRVYLLKCGYKKDVQFMTVMQEQRGS